MSEGLKVISLEIQNYRKIEAMEVSLDGKNMAVAGGTGEGKTTAISSLWELMKKVGDPIQHGKRKGQISIKLAGPAGRFVATRTFSKTGSQIEVVGEDGEKISAKDFRDWFCNLGVNPHQIMEMKPLMQTEALLQATELPGGVDLTALDKERREAAEERLALHRKVETLKESLGEEPEEVERVDLDDIQTRGEAARDLVRDIEQVTKALENDEKEYARLSAEIGRLRIRISEAKAYLGEFPLQPSQENLDELRRKLTAGQVQNEKAVRRQEWEKKRSDLAIAEGEHEGACDRVRALDEKRAEALENAEWPLPGLSIEEGVIHYHGVPLEQCGKSEQMLVCGALAASAVKKHKLHVIRMDGVEAMSREDFEALRDLLNSEGIQVFSSRVSRGDIEDGELVIVDGAIKPN